jgi:hypothetical protein
MQINATNNLTPLPEPGRAAAAPLTDQQQDAAVFTASDAIHRKLGQAPDARPEAVALARALITSTLYPPDETIRGIANLLAAKLSNSPE